MQKIGTKIREWEIGSKDELKINLKLTSSWG
jgi:hypothetical protein